MLQQILNDMYIDPDVLEALNEEQKKILFLKMRQEQVRRWKEREEKLEREGGATEKPKSKKGDGKSVSWLLGRDGDVLVDVIGETCELQTPRLILQKGCQNILRTNVINQICSEPVQTGTENVSPKPDIQLHFQGVPPSSSSSQVNREREECVEEKTEDSEMEPNLPPLQEQSGIANNEPEEDDDSESSSDDGSALAPYYRPHLRLPQPTLIADRLLPRGSQEESEGGHLSDMNRLCPPGSVKMDQGKDHCWGAASQRAEPGEIKSEPRDPVIGHGRVAQLRKTFGVASSSGTLPRTKPPLPNKPAHLLAFPSLR